MNCNAGNMRRYIHELREGNREQTTGRLAVKVGGIWRFCCLGVACERAIADGLHLDIEDATTASDHSLIRRRYGILTPTTFHYGNRPDEQEIVLQGSDTDLPEPVQKWLGIMRPGVPLGGAHSADPNPVLDLAPTTLQWLRAIYPEATFDKERLSAVVLNDEYKTPFPLIADCFEYTYLREDWDARVAS